MLWIVIHTQRCQLSQGTWQHQVTHNEPYNISDTMNNMSNRDNNDIIDENDHYEEFFDANDPEDDDGDDDDFEDDEDSSRRRRTPFRGAVRQFLLNFPGVTRDNVDSLLENGHSVHHLATLALEEFTNIMQCYRDAEQLFRA